MTFSRQANIPLDHVVAEVAAFPLASETALELGLTSLDANLPPTSDTARLWRRAEKQVLSECAAFSVDEVVAIRDKVWFADNANRTQVPLHVYLGNLSCKFLEARGSVAVPHLIDSERPKEHKNRSVLARQRWRWLAFALPPDLLLAALKPSSPGPANVKLMSPLLEQMLRERGYVETHLHVGAAIDFPLLWTAAIRRIASYAGAGEDRINADSFRSPGAALNEGCLLASWLVRAAIGRFMLAHFLTWGHRHGSFDDFRYSRAAEEWLYSNIGPADISMLFIGLDELINGRMVLSRLPFTFWQGLYAGITGITRVRRIQNRNEAYNADPIARLLQQYGGRDWKPEMRLISAAFAYLNEHPDDITFTKLFWQVVRVRNLFYRHMVQRPMTPGLQWFVRFYGRMSPAKRILSPEVFLESALVLGGIDEGLRALEVRTSPEEDRSSLLQYMQRLDKVSRSLTDFSYQAGREGNLDSSNRNVELGIVYHFTKARGGGARYGIQKAHWRESNADPGAGGKGNPTGYRYARYYNGKRREAEALAWLLHNYPLSLQLVRGLDVCTDELGVPNWVLWPLLRYVRRVADEGSAAARQLRGLTLPTLRLTAHAGEDFVHLLTGLRNVDEVINRFQFREGDRIGHGLALGLEPEDWARRAGRVAIAREERLLDLVWEWSWYGREGGYPGRGRQQFLEHEICQLSDQIFRDIPIPNRARVTPYDLEMLVEDLYNPERLQQVGFPNGQLISEADFESSESPPRLVFLYHYLRNRTVFQRGREIVWVEPISEIESLVNLQVGLRHKLGSQGITVEVNPTSNLLIGDLGDLTKHPLWRLHPPRNDGDAPPVSICIGSDDPLTFASAIRQEYQCLSDAMALSEFSDEETRQWLDRARASGLESRFTLPRKFQMEFHSVCNPSLSTVPLPP